jgi:aerobic-type carbon monoxide dehydrogenase small subunit (CoxS/CutS family)
MDESQAQARVLRTLHTPAQKLSITVNGRVHRVTATPDTPLLYVLRNDLHLSGPRFGCGLAQCGACTVHRDGAPIRACVTPVAGVIGRKITTLEGLAATYAEQKPGAKLHPVQQAWIDEQVPQCGYCQNGWMMYSAALLKKTPRATDAQIRDALAAIKCRCGTHASILRAVKRAQRAMA